MKIAACLILASSGAFLLYVWRQAVKFRRAGGIREDIRCRDAKPFARASALLPREYWLVLCQDGEFCRSPGFVASFFCDLEAQPYESEAKAAHVASELDTGPVQAGCGPHSVVMYKAQI